MPVKAAADTDSDARGALWIAIRQCAVELLQRFGVETMIGTRASSIGRVQTVPDVPTWRLVEVISAMGVLVRARAVLAGNLQLLARTGPIEFQEEADTRFLWLQPRMRGETSELGGQPDLVVTSTLDAPSPANVLRVIEAKCRRELDTQTIRAEFGKAHDLCVATYLIWTYYSPPDRIIRGAKQLGLDVMPLGFDTPRRKDLVSEPINLISHVAHTQEESRKAARFAGFLEGASREVQKKLSLRPN